MSNLSNLVESLAKQAVGGQDNTTQGQGGGILGSLLGGLLNSSNQQSAQGNAGGLGGLLGSVLGSLGQNQSQGANGNSGLLVAVLPLILGWIQNQGGLDGALAKLQQAGLGEQVNSWLHPDSGQNAPVADQQVAALFDDAQIEQVAAQTNSSPASVQSAIASVLPQIIDALTPDGQQSNSQQANADISGILSSVSGFLK